MTTNNEETFKPIPVTVFYCKYGKPDKDHPIFTELLPHGFFKDLDPTVIKSWNKPGCSACSGSGMITKTDANQNKTTNPCPCGFTRFLKSLPEDVQIEVIKRQKYFMDRRDEMKKKHDEMVLHAVNKSPKEWALEILKRVEDQEKKLGVSTLPEEEIRKIKAIHTRFFVMDGGTMTPDHLQEMKELIDDAIACPKEKREEFKKSLLEKVQEQKDDIK